MIRLKLSLVVALVVALPSCLVVDPEPFEACREDGGEWRCDAPDPLIGPVCRCVPLDADE